MTDLLAQFGITYRDSDHRYERFGIKVDSVSSCLPYISNEFLAAHPERIEKAGDRGRYIADKIEEVEQRWDVKDGTWPLFTMPSKMPLPQANEWVGCMNNFCKFKSETGFTALVGGVGADTFLASELFVYHDLLDYAGRLDLAGHAPNTGLVGLGLVEVKATAVIPKTVGPQSAAYFEAFNRCAKFYGMPKLKWRASLHLTAKGYKFVPLNSPLDWPRFNACLTATRWAREMGLQLDWKLIEASGAMDAFLPPEEAFADSASCNECD